MATVKVAKGLHVTQLKPKIHVMHEFLKKSKVTGRCDLKFFKVHDCDAWNFT